MSRSLAVMVICLSCAVPQVQGQTVVEAFATAPTHAGLVVHLGTTDGALEQQHAESGKTLVYGLALDNTQRDAARKRLVRAGVYGVATVATWPAQAKLPFAADSVNAVIARQKALEFKGIAVGDVMRVLVPGGQATFIDAEGKVEVAVKPWPKDLDDWTHDDYNASNNPVSRDTRVGPVTTLKWIDGYQADSYGTGARFWSWKGTLVHEMHAVAPRTRAGEIIYAVRDGFNGLPHYYLPLLSTSPAGRQATIVADGKLYTMAGADSPMGPLRAFDLTSGKEIQKFGEGGLLEDARKNASARWVRVVHHDGVLYQTADDALYALDAASGKRKWLYRQPQGLRLLFAAVAPDLGHIYVAQTERGQDKANTGFGAWGGRWPGSPMDSIVALDLATGKPVWTCRDVMGQAASALVYDAGRLAYFTASGILAAAGERGTEIDKAWIGALDARSGKVLWSRDYRNDRVPARAQSFAGWGFNLALHGGKAYLTNQNDIVQFDVDTGEPLRVFALPTRNARCTRPRLTTQFHLVGFGSFVDSELTTSINQDISRGGCTVGPTPANGMTYLTPAGCHCFAMLRGFAGYGSEPLWEPLPVETRLQREGSSAAPPFDKVRHVEAAPTFEWRKGTTLRRQTLQGNLVRNLAIEHDAFPHPETEPVKLGDLQLVAVVNEHRLEARQGDRVAWAFAAGGRISSPPLVHDGRAYVAAHDGTVTCLEGKTGRTLWSFLAAPNHRKIIAYGQLESSWPVYGVVLHKGLICASAGRHPELDGGLYLYGLDPQTGKARWQRRFHTAADAVRGSLPTIEGKPRNWRQPANTIVNGPLSVVDGELVLVSPDLTNEGIARPTEHYRLVIDPTSNAPLTMPTRPNALRPKGN